MGAEVSTSGPAAPEEEEAGAGLDPPTPISKLKVLEMQEDVFLLVLESLSSLKNMDDLFNIALVCKTFRVAVNRQREGYLKTFRSRNTLLRFDLPPVTHFARMLHKLLQPTVILLGGNQQHRQCDEFNPNQFQFRRLSSLSIKRHDEFSAVFHAGLVFVASGSCEISVGSVECYNYLLNIWVPQPSLPRPVASLSAASLRDQLYFLGGYDRGLNRRSTCIYRLNPRAEIACAGRGIFSDAESTHQTWHLCSAALTKGRSHHSSVAYAGKVWIAGGLLESQHFVTNTVEIFDPLTNTCIPGPPLKQARIKPGLVIVKGVLYAVGGTMMTFAHGPTTVERFAEESGRWEVDSECPEFRSKCSVCAAGSKIFLFGGANGGTVHNTWTSYDVDTKSWANAPSFHANGDPIPWRPKGVKCAAAVRCSF
ncbi:hypothetical protein B484DRAFT_454177 [Ochromonadaceae sp. CCMP2298]|nr:hypothetical protein B484DRAFT_454177 [Ochromonadaceae sp. CCMP2298]